MKYKHYLVYRITNNVDGRTYIGVHKTNNINDRYMGSSKELKRDIKRYGRSNFSKEILMDFSDPQEMYETEAVLVDGEFIVRSDTYNKALGGMKTIEYVNENLDSFRPPELRTMWAKQGRVASNLNGANIAGSKKHHLLLQTDFEYAARYWKAVAEGRIGSNCGFAGQRHTEESKQKISNANAATHKGSGNPNFGKKWMHNPLTGETKSIAKNDMKQMLTDGWKMGRIIK